MARSKIWKYYEKINLQTAQCLLCEKIIKTCGNTSNLMKHIKTHPTIDVNDNESIVVRGMLKRSPNSMRPRGRKLKYGSNKIKAELKVENDDTVGDMTGVNLIEFVEAAGVEDTAVEGGVNGETYANWTTAETESAAETASAVDIIEFEPKEAQFHNEESLQQLELPSNSQSTLQSTAYRDNLAYFLCRDKQPLELIEGEGFKRFMQVVCPAFSLPSTDQLLVQIDQKTQLQILRLRQIFASINSFSLSCAINTAVGEKALSYLEVTAHYHEGTHRRSRSLSVQMLPVQYNESSIVEQLEGICQRFDIDKSKVTCIVTSSSKLMEKAVSMLLGARRHVPCVAHLLGKVFDSVMLHGELSSMCGKVHSRKSEESQLIAADVSSFSNFEMLETYVLQVANLSKDGVAIMSPEELELATELIAIVAPLASAVRQLCGSSASVFPSASCALPLLFTILNEMKQPELADQQQSEIAYELRLFIVDQLEKCFESLENQQYLAFSSLLDPRFRNMPFQNSSLVNKYMIHLYENYDEKQDAGAADSLNDTSGYDIWSAYRAFSYAKHRSNTMSDETENQDEISSYFCASISSLQMEPLLLWRDLSQFHPFLYSISKKYLHIPASSIPPARLFTAAGAEVVAKQTKLMDAQMSNMLILSDCNLDEWQL